MDSNSNNTKSIKRKVVDQLVEGYQFTTQLQHVISNQTRSFSGSGLVDQDPANELIAKILGSFHKTISVLDSFEPVVVSVPITVEGSWNASCGDDSSAPVSCNGGDSSGDSRKKRLGVGKGKRGCYTRKKRQHTRIVEATSSEDRYAWRKYGQKEILNSNFPRSYFRCTHKPTQGCLALKKVQKLEQDPEMFQITYIGYHTCTSTDQPQAKIESFDNQEIIMDSHKSLATTTVHQNHVNTKVQEQENNNSSVTVVSTGMFKEEENYNGEGSSTGEELSLVWHDDMMMFEDHQQQHQNHYCGETSSTFHHYTLSDNDQFSNFFESYCEGL